MVQCSRPPTDVHQDSSKRAAEGAWVGQTVRHEELQGVARIERDELAKTLQRIEVGAAALQARFDSRGVIRRCDDDGQAALFEALADEAADDAAERIRVVVELHTVKMSGIHVRTGSSRGPFDLGIRVRRCLPGSFVQQGDLFHDGDRNLLEMRRWILFRRELLSHARTVAGRTSYGSPL